MAEGNGVADFVRAASVDRDGSARLLSNEDLEAVMTAAIKAYTIRAEQSGTFPPPVSPTDATATEVVTVVSEMLRAVDVNMFDLSMWFRRPRG
jgi:hypothetical protein